MNVIPFIYFFLLKITRHSFHNSKTYSNDLSVHIFSHLLASKHLQPSYIYNSNVEIYFFKYNLSFIVTYIIRMLTIH